MTCKDCNKPVKKVTLGRPFFCSGCWDLRTKVVSMLKTRELSLSSFREIQEGIARGEGQKAMLLATNPDLYDI